VTNVQMKGHFGPTDTHRLFRIMVQTRSVFSSAKGWVCPDCLQLVTLRVTIFKHGTPFIHASLRQRAVPILCLMSVTDFCLQRASAYKNLNTASCSSLVQTESAAAMLTLP
jgi:hypothetical protein